MEIIILGQSESVWREIKRRLESELVFPDLPTHRRDEVEGLLYWVDTILTEVRRRKK